jgi:hypothetical protein
MVIEKTNIEVENFAISEDGNFRRYLKGLDGEARESAIREVKNYEESVKGVIYTRLVERGVLSGRLQTVRETAEKPLTDEQKTQNNFIWLLDAVLDNDNACSNYFLFTPKTEQDIKDLAVYNKIAYNCDIISVSEDSEGSRYTHRPEVGKTYIYQANPDCEWGSLVSLEVLEKRVSKMCTYFLEKGKAQLKAAK